MKSEKTTPKMPMVKDSAQLFRWLLFVGTGLWLIIRGNLFSPSACPWRFCIGLFLIAAILIWVGVMRIHPVRMVCYAIVGGLLLLY